MGDAFGGQFVAHMLRKKIENGECICDQVLVANDITFASDLCPVHAKLRAEAERNLVLAREKKEAETKSALEKQCADDGTVKLEVLEETGTYPFSYYGGRGKTENWTKRSFFVHEKKEEALSLIMKGRHEEGCSVGNDRFVTYQLKE